MRAYHEIQVRGIADAIKRFNGRDIWEVHNRKDKEVTVRKLSDVKFSVTLDFSSGAYRMYHRDQHSGFRAFWDTIVGDDGCLSVGGGLDVKFFAKEKDAVRYACEASACNETVVASNHAKWDRRYSEIEEGGKR